MNHLRWLAIGMILAIGSNAPAQSVSVSGSKLDDLIDWSMFNRSGWKMINRGQYAAAEREFTAAIGIARRPSFDDHAILARSYADISYAIQLQGRLAEAEPLVRWSLDARRKLLEPDSPAVVSNLNQLAALYIEMRRFAEAEPLLRQATEVQDTSKKRVPAEHARSETLYGLAMLEQGKLDEAEKHFEKSLKLNEKTMGLSHPTTGDSVNNLAWIALEQGKYDQARPLFERALSIAQRTGPSFNSGSTAGTLEPTLRALEGLGKLNVAEQRWVDAQANLARAVEIRDEMGRGEDPSTSETLATLADVLERLGRGEEASKTRARARRIAPKTGLRTISRRFCSPNQVRVGS